MPVFRKYKKNYIWKKSANFKPGFVPVSGIESGSAFVKKAGSESAYDEWGSETLTSGTVPYDGKQAGRWQLLPGES
jgi:hypothetical protein